MLKALHVEKVAKLPKRQGHAALRLVNPFQFRDQWAKPFQRWIDTCRQ
jgi:hypothetical protein